jgi:hypothetical protein
MTSGVAAAGLKAVLGYVTAGLTRYLPELVELTYAQSV